MKARKVLNVFPLPHQARCVDWSADAQYIACGLNSGEVAICRISPDMKTIELLAKKNTAPPPAKDKKKKKTSALPAAEDSKKQKLWKVAEEVQDLKFSPDGRYLACGSRDNYIHVYDCDHAKGSYHRCAILRGHSSYVTHLDWTLDGSCLQSTDGAYEILYWEAQTWKQHLRPTELSDTPYHSWTCVLGWPVMGIWPDYSDGTDVGAVDASNSRKLLVTCDDFSQVKLMKFPCISKDCETKDYDGHSSHVMNVRFSFDDKYVCSVGGMDQSIFQWKVV